jgi:hypothetical protein
MKTPIRCGCASAWQYRSSRKHLSLYDESVSMSFTTYDGEPIRMASNGGTSRVVVDGSTSADWYGRHGS